MAAFAWIVPVLIILMGFYCAYRGIREMRLSEESPNWPVVPGVVVQSEVRAWTHHGRHGRSSRHYGAQILYEYTVDGQIHQAPGTRSALGTLSFTNDRETAQAMVDQYPVGLQVAVHYNPRNPKQAVLEPGREQHGTMLVVFGAIFIIAGVFFLVALMRWPVH